jgi:hypothetical protein
MGKHPRWFWIFNALFVLLVIAAVLIDPLRIKLYGWWCEFYDFAKEYTLAFVTGFFLVKGKFVFKIFAKKIILLSATGLTKRYLIEKVFTHHLKVHFFDHIVEDLKRLIAYIKHYFMKVSIFNKVVTLLMSLGSMAVVAKFMGKMLAIKVLLAKVWSFLLALFLQLGSGLVRFFTDYLWGSWLAPIIDVVIFGWVLGWLERVPYLKSTIERIYRWVEVVVWWFDWIMERLLHIPLRRMFKWLVKQTRLMIYRWIGYRRMPAYLQLRELRAFEPSKWQQLKHKREARKKSRDTRISRYYQRKEKK